MHDLVLVRRSFFWETAMNLTIANKHESVEYLVYAQVGLRSVSMHREERNGQEERERQRKLTIRAALTFNPPLALTSASLDGQYLSSYSCVHMLCQSQPIHFAVALTAESG
jgi:hypothetical protein